jgi:hypothetical protein
MASTDNSKWAVLRELARARFPEDVEVAEAMRMAEDLAGQQPVDAAMFVAATEAGVQAEVANRLGEALEVVNGRPRTAVGSRQAEEEAWALAAAMAAHQKKEVLEVAEYAARQAVAMLQEQSVDITTVESTVDPFLGT